MSSVISNPAISLAWWVKECDAASISAPMWEAGKRRSGAGGGEPKSYWCSTLRRTTSANRHGAPRSCVSALPPTAGILRANLVGGQDELVFDGGSFALDSRGEIRCKLPRFEEALTVVDSARGEPQMGEVIAEQAVEAEVYQALVLGVRDYLGRAVSRCDHRPFRRDRFGADALHCCRC